MYANRPTRMKFMCKVVLSSFVCVFLCFLGRSCVQLRTDTIASDANVYYRKFPDSEMLGVGN